MRRILGLGCLMGVVAIGSVASPVSGGRAEGATPAVASAGSLPAPQRGARERPATSARFDDRDEWIDTIIFMLESACVILDCYEARFADEDYAKQRVYFWIDTYNASGVRQGLTPAEKVSGRAHVEALYAHTLLNPGVFDAGLVETFIITLESIYTDLGGNPANL